MFIILVNTAIDEWEPQTRWFESIVAAEQWAFNHLGTKYAFIIRRVVMDIP